MPSPAQLKKIWLLSDTVLYRDAANFIQQLQQNRKYAPLPAKQANGLLNIAEAASYSKLDEFITHQRDRDWLPDKAFIKDFYEALVPFMSNMKYKRLRNEFHLLSDEKGRANSDIQQEADELMILLAREFIQHFVAENELLLAKAEEEKRNRNWQRPPMGNVERGKRGTA